MVGTVSQTEYISPIDIMYTLTMRKKATLSLSENRSHDRKGLHHLVAARLGTKIANGELQSGLVLPNENVLCEELGVSRTVLREAVKVLASKGLVEVRRKTGTRVRPTADWSMLDAEVLAWLFAGPVVPSTLAHLLDFRKMIEPAAARMATESATPQELLKIDLAYRKMEEVADEVAPSVEADLSFHLAILEATHNPFLHSFGSLIRSALRASFRYTSSNHALYLQSLKLHGAVIEAMKAREGALAERAMSAMLTQTSSDIAEQSAWKAKSKAKKNGPKERQLKVKASA